MTDKLTEVKYVAVATVDAGRQGSVRFADSELKLRLGMPPLDGTRPDATVTNPEQLFAAGYAACFHSALLGQAAARSIDVGDSTVTGKVELGLVERGGMGLRVELRVALGGVGDTDAEMIIEAAHARCPYSRAIDGNVEVTLVRV